MYIDLSRQYYENLDVYLDGDELSTASQSYEDAKYPEEDEDGEFVARYYTQKDQLVIQAYVRYAQDDMLYIGEVATPANVSDTFVVPIAKYAHPYISRLVVPHSESGAIHKVFGNNIFTEYDDFRIKLDGTQYEVSTGK